LDLLGLDKQSADDFTEQGYTPEQVKDTQRKHQRKQSTQGSALPVDIPTDHPRLSSLAILQPIVFCTLPGDITADYPPLYSACRYYN
jgi:hypothetical protein